MLRAYLPAFVLFENKQGIAMHGSLEKRKHYPSGSSRNFRGEMPIRSVNAPEKLASDR